MWYWADSGLHCLPFRTSIWVIYIRLDYIFDYCIKKTSAEVVNLFCVLWFGCVCRWRELREYIYTSMH